MKRLITLLLALAMLACLAACGEDGTTPPATDPSSQPGTSSTATEPSSSVNETVYNYKIRVVDQDGNPIAGAYVIFCLEQCNFYMTGEDGWALIDAEIADGYQAHIMSLPEGYEGYTFSEEYVNFESGQTEMTLVATKP